MTLDALACESQFIDHLAPIWKALSPEVRGQFLVEPRLVDHARARGLDPVPTQRPISIPAYPPPRHDGPLLLVASYGDIKVGRRLGYGPFVFIEHGAGQSYEGDPQWIRQGVSGSYAGGPDRDDVVLFLVPNAHAAGMWRKRYPTAQVELVGCPRLDELPQREPGPGPVVAIAFHWQTPMSLGPEAQNALGDYLPVLSDLAAAFTVIGHAHPKSDWQERMKPVYRGAGIPFVADFDDVCRQADVYVCDNSSTIFEFAATGRPVVLLNSQWYRKHIDHGLRFWEAATVGVQVDRPDQLIDAVHEALEDRPEQQEAREAALRLVYAHRQGAALKAAETIEALLLARGQSATSLDRLPGPDHLGGAQDVHGLRTELRSELRDPGHIGRRRAPDAGPLDATAVGHGPVERRHAESVA